MNWQAYLLFANAAADFALKLYDKIANSPDTPDAVKAQLAATSAQLAATRAAVDAFEA